MEVFWFIPTQGDGRYLGTSVGGRPIAFPYFAQVARAVDQLGFHGALLPTGHSCEDAWVTASALAPLTERMRFLVAVRPGLTTPGVAARMVTTFDRLSQGRLLLNIVTGGDPVELAGDGLHLTHDERYALTDEFLTVFRALLRGETVDFQGRHLDIRRGRLLSRPVQTPHPPLYFGGSSAAAMPVAARHVDFYLTWGEPPAQVGEKIRQVRERAAVEGRTLQFGIRLHVIVRETEAEAWAEADRLIGKVTDAMIARAQETLARYDSEGQRRMANLHRGDRSALRLGPNLWAGVGLVRGGAGTALVGDPAGVARAMQEYTAVGIDTFILSGYPHLEEAYTVAELLLPRLPLRPLPGPCTVAAPRGEMVANSGLPK